jgi:hypothetical protein
MTIRRRKYVVLVATILLSITLGLIARGWSDLEYYGAFAGLIALVGAIGLPWMELASDGAFRRPRRSA